MSCMTLTLGGRQMESDMEVKSDPQSEPSPSNLRSPLSQEFLTKSPIHHPIPFHLRRLYLRSS
jgi:hypothetical protein